MKRKGCILIIIGEISCVSTYKNLSSPSVRCEESFQQSEEGEYLVFTATTSKDKEKEIERDIFTKVLEKYVGVPITREKKEIKITTPNPKSSANVHYSHLFIIEVIEEGGKVRTSFYFEYVKSEYTEVGENCVIYTYKIPKRVLEKNQIIKEWAKNSPGEVEKYYLNTWIFKIVNDSNSVFQKLLSLYSPPVERKNVNETVYIYFPPDPPFKDKFLAFLDDLKNNRFINFEIEQQDEIKKSYTINWITTKSSLNDILNSMPAEVKCKFALLTAFLLSSSGKKSPSTLREILSLERIFIKHLSEQMKEYHLCKDEINTIIDEIYNQLYNLYYQVFNPPNSYWEAFNEFKLTVKELCSLMVKINLCDEPSFHKIAEHFFPQIDPPGYDSWLADTGLKDKSEIILNYYSASNLKEASRKIEEMWKEGKNPCNWTAREITKKKYIEGRISEIIISDEPHILAIIGPLTGKEEILWNIKHPIAYAGIAKILSQKNESAALNYLFNALESSFDEKNYDPFSHLIVLRESYEVFKNLGLLFNALESLRLLDGAKGNLENPFNLNELKKKLERENLPALEISPDSGYTTDSENLALTIKSSFPIHTLSIKNLTTNYHEDKFPTGEEMYSYTFSIPLTTGWNIIEIELSKSNEINGYTIYKLIKRR
jgi:hypothetical protein